MDYYTTLILLTIMTLLVLIVNVLSNRNFDRKAKRGFIYTFIIAIIGATCEWLGVICNGKEFFEDIRIDIGLHYLIKLIELTIVPVMPVIFSRMIFENKIKKSKGKKIIKIILIFYYCIQVISLIGKKLIFYVDSNNIYWHAKFYWIYIISFIAATIYMSINIFEFSKEYQNKNKMQLISIITFIIIGVSIQLINTSVKTAWLSLAISAALFYIYYTSIIQYVDGLTKLLNQRCYYAFLEQNADTMFTLIIFDVNNFKYVNDNFGHNFGDLILTVIGEIIKQEYGEIGRCYRIGGDEFAVLILNEQDENIKEVTRNFKKAIKNKRKDIPELPSIAFGMAKYNPDSREVHDISAIVEEADALMYKMKKDVKSRTMK